MTGRYDTPEAFRRALTDRLRALAVERKWPLPQLQRQFAYDRLLERVYMRSDRWIVKGATALLARDLGVRATIDVDLYREIAQDSAEAELRDCAALDLGDFFRFELGPRRPVPDGAAALRIPVVASVGTTTWSQFHVDLVGGDVRMTAEPEDVPALARVDIGLVSQHGYRAYPLVDHVADKVVATFEVHGEERNPSTRYKDLVDLVAIARGAVVDAVSQITAISSEARRRGVNLPRSFDVPDRALWERGYAAEARRCFVPMPAALADALAIAKAFIDPLLDGSARGAWNPDEMRWR